MKVVNKLEKSNAIHFVFTWDRKYFTFFIIIVSLCIITALFCVRWMQWKYPEKDYSDMSIQQQMIEYRKSWNHFKKTSGAELQIEWIKRYDDFKYKKGGDLKFNQCDCIGCLIDFFNSYGANMVMESDTVLLKRVKSLNSIGKNKIRKSYDTIKAGDIIFMKVNNSSHVALVTGKANGYVIYADMNAKLMRSGIQNISYKSNWIVAISEVSYDLWTSGGYK